MIEAKRAKVRHCEKHRKMNQYARQNSITSDLIKAGKVTEEKKCALCPEIFYRKPGVSDKRWSKRKYCDKHTGLGTMARRRMEAKVEAIKNPPPGKMCKCGKEFFYNPDNIKIGFWESTVYCEGCRAMEPWVREKYHNKIDLTKNPPDKRFCPCGDEIEFKMNTMTVKHYEKLTHCEKHRRMSKDGRERSIHECLVNCGVIVDTKKCVCGTTFKRKKGTSNTAWNNRFYCDKHRKLSQYGKIKLKEKYEK